VQAWLVATAAAQDSKSVPVTVENFIRAETDTFFRKRADLGPLDHALLIDGGRNSAMPELPQWPFTGTSDPECPGPRRKNFGRYGG
jgi:hypothetical protein